MSPSFYEEYRAAEIKKLLDVINADPTLHEEVVRHIQMGLTPSQAVARVYMDEVTRNGYRPPFVTADSTTDRETVFVKEGEEARIVLRDGKFVLHR